MGDAKTPTVGRALRFSQGGWNRRLARGRSRRMTDTSSGSHAPPGATAPTPRRHRGRTAVLAAALATIVTLGGLIGSETESGASLYGDSVGSTIADIQSYWAQTLPSVYGTNYKAIPSDRLFAY